jgi:hypothetical protein
MHYPPPKTYLACSERKGRRLLLPPLPESSNKLHAKFILRGEEGGIWLFFSFPVPTDEDEAK